jgi:hypothetical protein
VIHNKFVTDGDYHSTQFLAVLIQLVVGPA